MPLSLHVGVLLSLTINLGIWSAVTNRLLVLRVYHMRSVN